MPGDRVPARRTAPSTGSSPGPPYHLADVPDDDLSLWLQVVVWFSDVALGMPSAGGARMIVEEGEQVSFSPA